MDLIWFRNVDVGKLIRRYFYRLIEFLILLYKIISRKDNLIIL